MSELSEKAEKLMDPNAEVTIAIDGPSASGKGTIGAAIAEKFNMKFFSSGMIFRALAYKLKETDRQEELLDSRRELERFCYELDFDDLANPRELESSDTGELASKLSKSSHIRELLYRRYRDYLSQFSRIIVDGRDVGTKLLPNADIKLYLQASTQARAGRRYQQLLSGGYNYSYEEIYKALMQRDERDSNREYSPMRPAKNAIILDNSNLNLQQTLEKFENSVKNTGV
jgi:cytidylate kinase